MPDLKKTDETYRRTASSANGCRWSTNRVRIRLRRINNSFISMPLVVGNSTDQIRGDGAGEQSAEIEGRVCVQRYRGCIVERTAREGSDQECRVPDFQRRDRDTKPRACNQHALGDR